MSLPTDAMKIVRQSATVAICTDARRRERLHDTMLCVKAVRSYSIKYTKLINT